MITDNKSKATISGVYIIGDTKSKEGTISLATSYTPNWFRKFCTWAFLGWYWMPINKAKENGYI